MYDFSYIHFQSNGLFDIKNTNTINFSALLLYTLLLASYHDYKSCSKNLAWKTHFLRELNQTVEKRTKFRIETN